MEEGRALNLALSPVQVLALAAAGAMFGEWAKRRVPVLERLSIPASIVGGLIYAVASLALHARGIDVKADPTLRDVFQLVCFTIIGMNASLRVLVRGGVGVALLLALASFGAILQNVLGMALARAFGLNPLVGILAGAVSLAGGPATSLAFGATFEKAGVVGATTIALASATFGITVSGLIAGYVGGRLIRLRKLKPSIAAATTATAAEVRAPQSDAFRQVVLIAVAMGIGSLVSAAIERAGVVLPGYIGAMIVAALFRNIDDRWHVFQINEHRQGDIFAIALPLFIVMAMLTLRLWELAALAGPLIVILAAQVVLAWLLASIFVWWVMGRDYDSAVIGAGYCGFMLGVTANAIASMGELTRRFGPSPKAFIVVPMVGAFLIDFTNALIITAMANMLH